MKINWVKELYGEGRGWHVSDMVKFKGTYYISFCEGEGHNSRDSQIGLLTSTDQESWDFQFAITQEMVGGIYVSEPQLLIVGERLYLYAITSDIEHETEMGTPSWPVMSWSTDGRSWSQPKRFWMMDQDFWHPIEHEGRYWVTADNAGHVPTGVHAKVDLLTSEDGERWSWVSEILHGSDEPAIFDLAHNQLFRTSGPSETALCFLEDDRLLAITRAKGNCAALSIAVPPYEEWEHRLSEESRCYGADVAKVGPHYLVTGRSFDNEGQRALTNRFSEEGGQLGVFLYKGNEIELQLMLPGGGDTGYAAILAESDNDALIAYYSSAKYQPGPGSSIFLASVSIE